MVLKEVRVGKAKRMGKGQSSWAFRSYGRGANENFKGNGEPGKRSEVRETREGVKEKKTNRRGKRKKEGT